MIQLAVALLFAALVGCATHDPGTTPAGDHERQLLVMITAAPPHYRPGTSASGYGSGATRPRFDLAGLALARDHGMTLADDWPMPALGLHCFVMTIAAGQSREMLAAQLAADPRVESVQPVQLFRTLARNDPYYAMQSSARALDLDGLHQIATGRNVRIAQVDTGVDLSHPDLLGALTDGEKLRRRQQLRRRGARHGGGGRDGRPRRQQPRHSGRCARRDVVAVARLLAGPGRLRYRTVFEFHTSQSHPVRRRSTRARA